ncbi:MAG: CidA/LrgA family protein [Bosea sp. (in: a-proteobacteria)]
MTILLGCQLAGEVTVRLVRLPVPGPVLGLMLLFVLLQLRARFRPDAPLVAETSLGAVTAVLLGNLGLMFVPVGTGIVKHAGTLVSHGPGLLLALTVSTALTIAVTAFVFVRVAKWTGSSPETTEAADAEARP